MTRSDATAHCEPPPLHAHTHTHAHTDAHAHIALAEPLVESVRAYLARSRDAPSAPPHRCQLAGKPPALPPHTCDADIGSHTAREDLNGINFEPRLKRNDVNNNAAHHRQQQQQQEQQQPQQQPGAGSERKMPSHAEMMQRQPLLARGPKPEQPQPTTDESDPDQEHSPRHNGEFVVEIGAGALREERYPKEIWKTLVSFVFLFVCVCCNMLSLSLVHERLPDNSTAPLPDVVLDNVQIKEWALSVSEYLIMLSTTTATLVVVFHKHRFIVARRVFLLVGLLYLYRSFTIYVTVVPKSNPLYFCSPKDSNLTALVVVRRVFYLMSGFGLSINGKHTYCGDYIYSGHTMVLVLSYLIVAEYSPRKLWPLHWALWSSAALGVSFVLLSHGHYTIDVLVAYYITTRLFWTFHALLALPQRAPQPYMIAREWWYFIFKYFEKNVKGPVPRRCNWPLPWPKTKLFSRLR